MRLMFSAPLPWNVTALLKVTISGKLFTGVMVLCFCAMAGCGGRRQYKPEIIRDTVAKACGEVHAVIIEERFMPNEIEPTDTISDFLNGKHSRLEIGVPNSVNRLMIRRSQDSVLVNISIRKGMVDMIQLQAATRSLLLEDSIRALRKALPGIVLEERVDEGSKGHAVHQ